MKLLVVFLGLCVALAASESCFSDANCNHETCTGDGWTVNCHRGTCTCDHDTHTGTTCSGQSDCSGGNCPNNLNRHCFDGHCRCLPGN